MASFQSHIIDFLIRRVNIFNEKGFNPQAMRSHNGQAGFMMKLHHDVQMVPVMVDTVPAEWLIPQGAAADHALLYLHGGAWSLGSPEVYRRFVSGFAYASQRRALVIDYRLAPENPFPAALDDCLTSYKWLLGQGLPAQKIVVAGDSAGGNLTLALLVALRDAGTPLPAGAVTISPATDLAGTGESYTTRKQLDPFFYRGGMSGVVEGYIATYDVYHPYISPLYADLHGLPPLLIHVGDHEILLDDALRFGQRAAEAGVEVQTVVWPKMFHVFQMFDPILPEARQANEQIAQFIRSRI